MCLCAVHLDEREDRAEWLTRTHEVSSSSCHFVWKETKQIAAYKLFAFNKILIMIVVDSGVFFFVCYFMFGGFLECWVGGGSDGGGSDGVNMRWEYIYFSMGFWWIWAFTHKWSMRCGNERQYNLALPGRDCLVPRMPEHINLARKMYIHILSSRSMWRQI